MRDRCSGKPGCSLGCRYRRAQAIAIPGLLVVGSAHSGFSVVGIANAGFSVVGERRMRAGPVAMPAEMGKALWEEGEWESDGGEVEDSLEAEACTPNFCTSNNINDSRERRAGRSAA